MNVALKPFRQYEENDVINLFALDANSGDKGSLVIVKGSGWVNNQSDFEVTSLTSQGNVVSWRMSVPYKLQLAPSGATATTILGMMLYDIREVNYLGLPLIYDKQRKEEAQCVVSGEAVPVVTKGLFLVSGNWGTGAGQAGVPGVGSGAVASDAGAGAWKVVAAGTSGSIGRFLGAADADGFALFQLAL